MSNLCSLERAPAYRLHRATGQAIVTIGGRDIYLGKHGTAASHQAYRRTINEWTQGGGQLTRHKHSSSVAELVVAYAKFATDYYRKDGKPTDEVRMIKTAIKFARQLYARTPAIEFGPLALKACREKMIERDWCRSHINQQIGRVKRMFRWATANEMIPGSNYEALRCVEGMKRGRTDAKEGRKVKPISDVDIHAMVGLDEVHCYVDSIRRADDIDAFVQLLEQIERYKIPHGEKVKKGDKTRGPAFRKLYGDYVYEVEALPDGELPKLLDNAIRSVLDLEAFNYEVEQEKQDAAQIEATQSIARSVLWGIDLEGTGDE